MNKILLDKEIVRFSDINDLEETLLEIYRDYSKNISKDNYMIQINKIVKRVKNIKDENDFIVINLTNNEYQFIFKKYNNGEIGMYEGFVFDHIKGKPIDN